MENYLCVDRVAFSVGGYDIYWYGIMICAGIILAILVASLFCKKKGYPSDLALNIALVILPTGILCARLFAVIFEPGLTINDYFNFQTGGMSIIGAIVGGGIGLLLYTLITRQKNILRHFDVLTVVLILAQAVGRWGNYFNSEVYGQVIESSSFFAQFPFAVEIDGVFYQALFFYESVACLVGFIMLSKIFFATKNSGYTTAWYLIFYGIIRTVLEPMRQAEFIYTYAGFQVSRVLSIAMIVIGVIMFAVLLSKNKKAKVVKNEENKN